MIFQHEKLLKVTSRKGRVSRNHKVYDKNEELLVTSRKGRVSRNGDAENIGREVMGHVPQGACE